LGNQWSQFERLWFPCDCGVICSWGNLAQSSETSYSSHLRLNMSQSGDPATTDALPRPEKPGQSASSSDQLQSTEHESSGKVRHVWRGHCTHSIIVMTRKRQTRPLKRNQVRRLKNQSRRRFRDWKGKKKLLQVPIHQSPRRCH
jgi:hypothetical protein